MSTARRVEMILGFTTLIIGLLILIFFVLLGQIYSFASSTGERGTASLLDVGIQPITLVFFGLYLLGLIAVALGATLHSRTGANRWRIVLWTGTGVIGIFTILALASVGQLFIPVVLCAIFTCGLSLVGGEARPDLM